MKKYLSLEVGQGLTEYLILVCLISIASIAVVSVVGQNIQARYKNISQALHGDKPTDELKEATQETYALRGFKDFKESAVPRGQ